MKQDKRIQYINQDGIKYCFRHAVLASLQNEDISAMVTKEEVQCSHCAEEEDPNNIKAMIDNLSIDSQKALIQKLYEDTDYRLIMRGMLRPTCRTIPELKDEEKYSKYTHYLIFIKGTGLKKPRYFSMLENDSNYLSTIMDKWSDMNGMSIHYHPYINRWYAGNEELMILMYNADTKEVASTVHTYSDTEILHNLKYIGSMPLLHYKDYTLKFNGIHNAIYKDKEAIING
jgi:hypothetical protein